MSLTAIEKNISGDVSSWINRNIQVHPAVSESANLASAVFQKLGLPSGKTEEFKYTPIARVLDKNFNFSLENPLSELDPSAFIIKGLEANILVFINGIFSVEHSSIISPESEISIVNLSEALLENPEQVIHHFDNYANSKTNAFAAWNTASWKDGIFIHVPDGSVVGKPIVFYHVYDTTKNQVIAVNRNLLIVGKNSNVTILEKFDSIGKANCFSNLITEVFVDEYAELNFYSVQNDFGYQYQYNLKEIRQVDNSRVNTFTFTLNGKLIRNDLHVSLDGEKIESHLYGLYLLTGDTLTDNHTAVDHKKPNSFSNELYKGIMDENSKGVFNGKIYVRPYAQKTNAFQSNKNILLTNTATVNTKPQLEIWADDVKCSHGCTTGQLDEEALFYLQSRGIQKETARAMMLYAFAAQLLESVKHPVIGNYLDSIIRERLTKEF